MGGEPRFRKALAWSYVMDAGEKVISLVIAFLLAALLGPTVFGTMALALVYVFFIELLVTQGLLAALIQRRDLTDAHLDTAFWLLMAFSILGFGFSVLLGQWWADVQDVPELATVIPVLSLYLPLKGLLLVQEAVFRRRLDFKTLAIRVNIAAVVAGVVGVVVALAGGGIWALVAQQLTLGVVDVAILWTVSPWRPRLRWSRRAARELLSFSGLNFLAAVGLFVSERSDAVVIGLFFGPTAVGLFRFAARFVDLVFEFALRSLQGVALPGLALLQDDTKAFGRRAGEVFRLAALTVPLLAVLAGLAQPLTEMAGEEWAPAAPVLQILCLAGVFRIVFFLAIPMLQAKGRPGVLGLLTWAGGVLGVATLCVAGVLVGSNEAVRTELIGLATSRVVAAVGLCAITLVLLHAVCSVSARVVIRAFAGPVMAGVVVALAVIDLRLLMDQAVPNPYLQCFILGLFGAALSVVMLAIVSPWFLYRAREVMAMVSGRWRLRAEAGGSA